VSPADAAELAVPCTELDTFFRQWLFTAAKPAGLGHGNAATATAAVPGRTWPSADNARK
jgi:hypothetical protein